MDWTKWMWIAGGFFAVATIVGRWAYHDPEFFEIARPHIHRTCNFVACMCCAFLLGVMLVWFGVERFLATAARSEAGVVFETSMTWGIIIGVLAVLFLAYSLAVLDKVAEIQHTRRGAAKAAP